MQFYINNVMNNNLYIEDEFEIPSLNTEIETREIQGRDGFLLGEEKVKGYNFPIPFIYVNHEKKNYQDIVNEIVEHMITNHEVRLRFEDEYWYWNVRFSGTIQFKQRTQGFVSFELNCIVTDPFKHSNSLYNTVSQNDHLTIYNRGTARTYPVFKATAKKNATMFMAAKNDEDYIMFGKTEDTDRDTKNFDPVVFTSEHESLVGWTKRTLDIDDPVAGGKVNGTIKTDGETFLLNNAGTATGWDGGALQRSLSRTISNYEFKTAIRIEKQNTGHRVAKGFMHLTDEQGNLVCSIGLIDSRANKNEVRAVCRIYDKLGNPKDIYNTASSGAFNRGKIYLSLTKTNNKFQFRTWKYNNLANGKRQVTSQSRTTFTDKKGDFDRSVRLLTAYIAKNSKFNTVPTYIYKTTVQEKLQKESNKIPVVIQAGDTIEIDMQNELMTLNEEPVTDLKDFGANYYNIPDGLTEIFILPENTFDVTAEWRDRFY